MPAPQSDMDKAGEEGGSMSADWQQQAELEQEHMAHNLEALKRIEQAGLPDVARDLAGELGLTNEYQHLKGDSNATSR